MKALKILVVIVALVAIAGMVTDTWAQCSSARLFRSSGKGGLNVRIDSTGAQNGGNEIGRFWDTQNAAFSNNGLTGPSFGNLCPASLFWSGAGTTLRFVDGFLTAGACVQTGCPAQDLTVVVEDYDLAGPPGVGGTAYYVGWAVTETPAGLRWYDYGQVDGVAVATTFSMLEFPRADIVGSSRNGANVEVTVAYADQSNSVHTWLNGAVAPTASVVAEWHLMRATGTADPGRLRSNWVREATVVYVPGGTSVFTSVPCTDTVQDEFLAIGIGFAGGTAGIVDSALVGPAVALECDPNLAQPDDVKQEFKRNPANTELQAKPGRSGGRR